MKGIFMGCPYLVVAKPQPMKAKKAFILLSTGMSLRAEFGFRNELREPIHKNSLDFRRISADNVSHKKTATHLREVKLCE
jgi:hypothetical protein